MTARPENIDSTLLAEDIAFAKRKRSSIVWIVAVGFTWITLFWFGDISLFVVGGSILTCLMLSIQLMMDHIKYEIYVHESLKKRK